MNLKFAYGLIFGLLGVIVGSVFIVVSLTGGGILWTTLFKETPWPAWSGIFFRAVGFLGIVGAVLIEIWCIRKGFICGERFTQELEPKKALRLTVISCVIVLIALIVYIPYFSSQLGPKIQKIMNPAISSRAKSPTLSAQDAIMELHVQEVKDAFHIRINVLKSSVDPHRLTVQVMSAEPIWEVSENIHLDYSKQRFVFKVPLSKVLPQLLEGQGASVHAVLETLLTNGGGSIDEANSVVVSQLTVNGVASHNRK